LIQKLRKAGIKAELFPGSAKMKKQMSYADDKKIPYVALVGDEEISSGLISLKRMTSGEQTKLSFEEILQLMKG
jgi:histidyl-tRNA synthetase